jgi:Signal recognition particle 9 kDa protein (SRP9)
MPYLPDLNTYLHQSSLLIQAYPTTTRITTKYSLPRRPNPKSKSRTKPVPPAPSESATIDTTSKPHRERLPPSATLTLKTFEPGSGICLKYKTDKAAEVGRLLTGLGRLAGGEVIEMPLPTSAPVAAPVEDKMEVDEVGSGAATPKVEDGKVQGQGQGQPQAQGGGGKGKKKKGKK